MIKKIVMSLLVLLLIGCSPNNTETKGDQNEPVISYDVNDYSIILPFEMTNSRYWFSNTLSKMDAIEMPKSLQDHAKKNFDVQLNYLKSGNLLTYDDIQMLQRRESASYPYALNPAEGDFKISDTKSITSPYIVSGVFEIDFVSKEDSNKLTGIALAILLDSEISQEIDGQVSKVAIQKDYLMAYGSTIGHKLERYMRSKPDVDPDLPIYIMLYDAKSESSYVPGNFIAEGMFLGRSGQFSPLSEHWYILPGDEINTVDGILANKFQTAKNLVSQFMPENVSFVGKVKYTDNYPTHLSIEVVVQAKTYTEIYALAQYVKDVCKTFDQEGLEIIVEIDQMDKTMFVISKGKASTAFTVQDMN